MKTVDIKNVIDWLNAKGENATTIIVGAARGENGLPGIGSVEWWTTDNNIGHHSAQLLGEQVADIARQRRLGQLERDAAELGYRLEKIPG